ncbi:MAG TPA: ATPase, T2SS/T4P/T4SS family, partial [Euzebyales bacterium]|nr:ATPase, T2SS/T4P/T4SS family [Euzebyales bacterium]
MTAVAPAPDTALVARLARDVADRLSERIAADGQRMAIDDERSYAHMLINAALEHEAHARLRRGLAPLTVAGEQALARAVHDRLFGLGRLQRFLDDPDVSDVAINGCDRVFVTYRDGRRERVAPVADSDVELIELVRLAAARIGRTERRFDTADPELTMQLPDGSRLHAIRDVSGRPCVSIRRHRFELSFLSELVACGMLTAELAGLLGSMVRARKNIVVCGATGAGKTTMLRALVNEIPPGERLVTIEDSLELDAGHFDDLHPDVVALEARHPNIEGRGGVTLEQLVRMGLRMNPDRVLVGEVRGPELVPMLLAMTQGRDGSMCTMHAASARHVFDRALMYGLLPPYELPVEASAHLFAGAVDFVVFVGDERSRADTERRRRVQTVL